MVCIATLYSINIQCSGITMIDNCNKNIDKK